MVCQFHVIFRGSTSKVWVKNSTATKCPIIWKKCISSALLSPSFFWLQKIFVENPTISTLASAPVDPSGSFDQHRLPIPGYWLPARFNINAQRRTVLPRKEANWFPPKKRFVNDYAACQVWYKDHSPLPCIFNFQPKCSKKLFKLQLFSRSVLFCLALFSGIQPTHFSIKESFKVKDPQKTKWEAKKTLGFLFNPTRGGLTTSGCPCNTSCQHLPLRVGPARYDLHPRQRPLPDGWNFLLMSLREKKWNRETQWLCSIPLFTWGVNITSEVCLESYHGVWGLA